MIVEENKQHEKALSYFLGAHEISNEIVNNVSQSIEALKRHEIDCVIPDMGIPNKNAYETLETQSRKIKDWKIFRSLFSPAKICRQAKKRA